MRSFFKNLLIISTVFTGVTSQLIIPQVVMDHGQEIEQIVSDPSALNPPLDDFIRGPMLSDKLALESDASIFFEYARQSYRTSGILSGLGEYGGQKFTVFVPTNKAVMALARKPNHLDQTEITEEEADTQSQDKVERWVCAHIVPEVINLDKPSSKTYQTLLDDKSLTLSRMDGKETPEWANWLVNSEITIIAQREASNGVMYLIQGTIEV